MPAHTHLRVDRLRAADQHSLRIAAAERTSPAQGTVIYQCDRPPCSTHSRARRLRGSAGADDHEVVGFHEVVPSESKSQDGQVAPVVATSLSALASSCALMATMIVLSDMRAAPMAGLMTIPHG